MGFEESDVKSDVKKHNKTHVNSFINTIQIAAKFKSVLRLGKPDPAKKRPIMVILTVRKKRQIL